MNRSFEPASASGRGTADDRVRERLPRGQEADTRRALGTGPRADAQRAVATGAPVRMRTLAPAAARAPGSRESRAAVSVRTPAREGGPAPELGGGDRSATRARAG